MRRGSDVNAGSMSYVSQNPREPLSALEEAMLIAATGASGLTMPDRPFADPETGETIMSKPNLGMAGRTAGSPDNAQGTYFFMINDQGTYFLRHLPPAADGVDPWTPETLIARAEQSKVMLLDRRIDVAEGMRDFPAYLDSNRFLSNLPGTTIFFPVVDLSHQYINGLMYLITQPAKARPTIVDDRNFYRVAGVKKWVKNGFLNQDIKIPLGVIQQMRTQLEATLLTQNLFLVAEAMGLGAWIHGALSPPVLMGDPKFRDTYGKLLDFDHVTPPVEVPRFLPLGDAADQADEACPQPCGRPPPQGRDADQGRCARPTTIRCPRRSTRSSPRSSVLTASTRTPTSSAASTRTTMASAISPRPPSTAAT